MQVYSLGSYPFTSHLHFAKVPSAAFAEAFHIAFSSSKVIFIIPGFCIPAYL
jgi:hypothetical protein